MKVTKRMLPTAQIRADIPNDSVNEESRTVELTWTTGSKGLRRDWDGPFYEELEVSERAVDMTRLKEGAPLLAAHDQYDLGSVIGVVERAWLENGLGKALVRFAKDEKSDAVFHKVKDRILRNVSVGYSVSKYENVSEKGDEVPTFRATRWQPAEISIVPIGFDSGAKTRSQNQTESEVEVVERSSSIQETVMSKEIQPSAVDAEALKKEAAQAERQRANEIRKLVREAKLDEKLADDLISSDVPLDQARNNIAMFAKYTTAPVVESTTRVEVSTDEVDKKREAASEAILHRLDPMNFKPSQGNPFTHMSLLRIYEELRGGRKGMSDSQLARAAMSSSDLPYILANVAEKSAQKKYDAQPRTWSQWASRRSLRNFKTHDQVRSGDFASLEERQESGEFKRGSFGEEREQVTLKEFGKILAFTRRMLINDDLSEIQKVMSQAGSAAARLENRLVYEQLTGTVVMGDGENLFDDTAHGNVDSSAAFSDTTIGTAIKKMRIQTSVDGLEKLNIAPKYVLHGPEIEATVLKYLAVIQPNSASSVNPYSGSLIPVCDAEISNNDYFFAADPNQIETVTLFHLEGEEKPRIESRIDFEKEELELKCAHSCVAKAMDWRGLVKNAGGS